MRRRRRGVEARRRDVGVETDVDIDFEALPAASSANAPSGLQPELAAAGTTYFQSRNTHQSTRRILQRSPSPKAFLSTISSRCRTERLNQLFFFSVDTLMKKKSSHPREFCSRAICASELLAPPLSRSLFLPSTVCRTRNGALTPPPPCLHFSLFQGKRSENEQPRRTGQRNDWLRPRRRPRR